ncbi:MAG: argininosuccinate lyase [Tannerellaceae bacterium]|nr:argininosuccinate lyase [Tannerellaceae bacterium]
MAQKLWDKNIETDGAVEVFTVGRDREMDLFLAEYDVLGSIAHAIMLCSVGLLTEEERDSLTAELRDIYHLIGEGRFIIEEGVEDVHSQVELLLTRTLGDTGKKIHCGRSRNDQVLLDLKLFTRDRIRELVENVHGLANLLIELSERYRDMLMPGYTHLQIAMPSSFGLWFGAYAESLADDLTVLLSAYRICNRNPLGSAAGYGSSFPIDRQMTTDLLGFDSMNYNSVYAQMGRGKMERITASAVASVAATLSKLSCDACLFNSQNFGFIKLPDRFTTGSSIMPHKKNPDVFELTRAKCNRLQSIPQQLILVTNNLPSGYFRDLQTLKEIFIPSFGEISDCIRMTASMLAEMQITPDILLDGKYINVFSVEEVNRLAASGVPFRDAYKQVAGEIQSGAFVPNRDLRHTHQGSIGNLCNTEIARLIDETISQFNFPQAETARQKLLAR